MISGTSHLSVESLQRLYIMITSSYHHSVDIACVEYGWMAVNLLKTNHLGMFWVEKIVITLSNIKDFHLQNFGEVFYKQNAIVVVSYHSEVYEKVSIKKGHVEGVLSKNVFLFLNFFYRQNKNIGKVRLQSLQSILLCWSSIYKCLHQESSRLCLMK